MKKQESYLAKKQARAEVAFQWTRKMERLYFGQITTCVDHTNAYLIEQDLDGWEMSRTKSGSLKLSVVGEDTVQAAFQFNNKNEKLAILNFASFKHPGGGFISGSMAQEESLCHKSFLYNVLKEFDDTYYHRNKLCYNNGLYANRALYTPGVLFWDQDQTLRFDVITCAAPNYSAAKQHVTQEENDECLRKRIEFVLKIATKENVDTLIVGAWGCGVFQQDPKTVAQYFKNSATELCSNSNMHLVFAILPPKNPTDINLQTFKQIIEK